MTMKTHLDPEDRLSLALANERVARANADAKVASTVVLVEQMRMDSVRVQVSAKYGLGPGDNMNFDTGEITRAPRPDVEPKPEPKKK